MNPSKNGETVANAFGNPTRLIVLGFYDGPTDGVIQFGDRGRVFRFRLTDEERQLSTPSPTREYNFYSLPMDALNRIVEAISPNIAPTWPVWFPLWRFPSQEIEDSVSAAVDTVLAEAGALEWRVATTSCNTFGKYEAHHVAVENAVSRG